MNAEVEYAIGRFMRVRKLAGVFQVTDSWMVGGTHHKRRRYKLNAVKGTGALLETTESFADGMEPLPAGAMAEELTLAPDPFPSEAVPPGLHIPDATAPQEPDASAGHAEPAPGAAQPVADAIRSPASGPDPGFTLDEGAFGGELDPYSIGANQEPGELQNPFKSVRRMPRRPTYRELRGIIYNARIKGFEDFDDIQISKLDEETPVAVAVTTETNGHSVWIITVDETRQARNANLEIFYPNAQGSSADALEYAVLLALRQVPIRTEDLEILLLQLG